MEQQVVKQVIRQPIEQQPIERQIEKHLKATVTPIASQLDSESSLLFSAFEALGQKGWLAPKLANDYGALALSNQKYQQFQSLIAQHSGALAFLQTQHQSAASLLASSENEPLKQTYLPKMVTGAQKVGVGFSQLRRRPVPLKAEKTATGYRIDGIVPWVTGAGLFTHFISAATLPDGRAVFGLLPLKDQQSSLCNSLCKLTVGRPMSLAGMSATNTVEVRLDNWQLAQDQVVAIKPTGWIEGRDRANPLSPIGLIFGCTQAAINELQVALAKRKIDHPASQQLALKLAWLRMDAKRVVALPEDAYMQKMALRGKAIALMNTCAEAAVVAASGAANTTHHPAQRIYKEALVFSVSGQTTQGAIATLNALIPNA